MKNTSSALGTQTDTAQRFGRSTFCASSSFIQSQTPKVPSIAPRISVNQSQFLKYLFFQYPHCSGSKTSRFFQSGRDIPWQGLWKVLMIIHREAFSNRTILSTWIIENCTWMCLMILSPSFPLRRKWVMTKSEEIFSCCWVETVRLTWLTFIYFPRSGQYCSDCFFTNK